MLVRRSSSSGFPGAFGIMLAVLLFAGPSAAIGQKLLMFESDDCSWCRQWHAEVGDAYEKTEEGRKLPLRTMDIHDNPPAGIQLREPVRYTPTFVVVNERREVGRITGYPGEAHFWGLLNTLIERIED